MGQIFHRLPASQESSTKNMKTDGREACPMHGTRLLEAECDGSENCWATFHEAVVKGNLELCRQLLLDETCGTKSCLGSLRPCQRLQRLDTLGVTRLRTTALHMASLYRRPAFVKMLLEHGADPAIMDGFGRAPAAVLLEHWPRVTFPPSLPSQPPESGMCSSLLSAVPERAHNSDTLLQLLMVQEDRLDRSSGVDSRSGGELELFRKQVVAWRARSSRCLKLLLRSGFSINQVADRRRASTLLHLAARYDLVDVIQMLLSPEDDQESVEWRQLACDGCQQCPWCQKSEQLAGTSGEQSSLPGPDCSGTTRLASSLKQAVVRHLNTVHHSCRTSWMHNQTRKNRLCQHRHSDTPPPLDTPGRRRKNAVCRMSSSPTESTSRQEGEEGSAPAKCRFCNTIVSERWTQPPDLEQPDLEVRNGMAKTPLAVAVDRGSLNAAHCLLSHGADVFPVDFYGRSILHFLSERDSTFDLLMWDVVRQGVDVNLTDNGGNTALHVAAYMGNVGKVRFLLDRAASPDCCNLAGKSPLFLALQRRDSSAREIILLFLLASDRVNVRDKLGRLPMLLQGEENADSARGIQQMHAALPSLLRRCVVTVRRALGISRLLTLNQLPDLQLPVTVQRALLGDEERRIANCLLI